MTSVIGDERENAEFPATMGVNAFRGYLDEFLLTMDDKPRAKKHKRNRRQAKKKKDKVRVVSLPGYVGLTLYGGLA